MAAILRDSIVVVAVVVVRTRPRAIPLAMITMRKSTHEFPCASHMSMGLRLVAHRAAGAPLLKRLFHRAIPYSWLSLLVFKFFPLSLRHEYVSRTNNRFGKNYAEDSSSLIEKNFDFVWHKQSFINTFSFHLTHRMLFFISIFQQPLFETSFQR